ncbi:hypothetical protein AB6A40_001397 [Gnathostoma spinigerum]|uniref:BAH domain-containing protein n=1 Tax=Gnathostoma spinigerum TaxID=75299 RepID=A0ABD6E489_9BILA
MSASNGSNVADIIHIRPQRGRPRNRLRTNSENSASGSGSNGSHATRGRKPLARLRKRTETVSTGGIAFRRSAMRSAALFAHRNTNTYRSTLGNTVVNKYINRRTSLFKSKKPTKAPRQKATMTTHQFIYDEDGRRFDVGDIVSMVDDADGPQYFAQIRGIITDNFAQRLVALNWLIPLETADDPHVFVGEQFVHGISDVHIYPLKWCTFVQHAPSLAAYGGVWDPKSGMLDALRREVNERSAEILHFNYYHSAKVPDELTNQEGDL